jgi:homocysteine S-methyltransferase
MARERNALPQLGEAIFLTDGGLETTLIFHEGLELPHFASFVLLETEEGRRHLRRYYESYLAIARERGLGFVLDTPTWRANPDWGARLGYDAEGLRRINQAGIRFLQSLRDEWETPRTPCVVSGVVGPRGDGYRPGVIAVAEAERYHAPQIAAFAGAGADLVGAFTLTDIHEAAGIARAAAAQDLPCALSFTVETDGRLASGPSLREAIEAVDAETGGSPAYYMVNCAHPSHFEQALAAGEAWTGRLRGIRANASMKSHAELDRSATLDDGDPEDLGQRYHALRQRFPALRLLGGCCGTDARHLRAICEACLPA